MKICCIIILSFFTGINIIVAQEKLSDKSPTVQYLIKWGYTFPDSSLVNPSVEELRKWPKILYYNTIYKAKILGSPTLPFNFTKIDLVDGKVEVISTISLGYGYTWFTGDFLFNEYDKIIVNPSIYFGAVSNVGLQSNLSFNRLGSFFIGGFVGIGSFSFFAGYDFISLSPAIGLGGRLDLYSIWQDFLKPIGKVHELRKHKSFAIPITYE